MSCVAGTSGRWGAPDIPELLRQTLAWSVSVLDQIRQTPAWSVSVASVAPDASFASVGTDSEPVASVDTDPAPPLVVD